MPTSRCQTIAKRIIVRWFVVIICIFCLLVSLASAQGDSPQLIRGDANDDERINNNDVLYLVNFLFHGGPPPMLLELGDVNCDGALNLADLIYLIEAIYKAGPPPCDDPI